MAETHFPLYTLIGPFAFIFFASSVAQLTDDLSTPKFAFSWLDDKNEFQAGDTATVKIKVLGNFNNGGNASLDKSAFKPTFTVKGKMGNSSYVSGVFLDVNGDPSTWRILFTPILVGIFNVLISDERFKVLDSSLHFEVEAGQMYPSVCIASWMGLLNEFEVGKNATVLILPKDAFGNNISLAVKEASSYNYSVYALYENGSVASTLNITYMSWNDFGYIVVKFIILEAGNFLLHVEGDNQVLNGAPLPFKVNPGPLDVSNCVARWNFEMNEWQIFSKMEVFLHQQDQYGNLVPGLYEFDADVIEKGTNLSIPIADLQFEEVKPGIQLFSFSLLEPGSFLLTVSDAKHNKSISNMPFAYTVYVGYCNGSTSVVNGSGLNGSISGQTSAFSVYLNDAFLYPCPIELKKLQVQIMRENDSYFLQPSIHPRDIGNGSGSTGELHASTISQIEPAPLPSVGLRNTTSSGREKFQSSAFNVIYTPEKSGIYKIHVFCGNILLNGGLPFTLEVKAGMVNISLSRVVKFSEKVPKLIKNEIVVQLVDSFSNPMPLQQLRLKLEIASVNRSGFSSWMFLDNGDGIYTGSYLAEDVGTYEMCVSFDGKYFLHCPFGVNVYSSEYFPKAYDDTVSVWEDESIAFDALANDYFAGDNASIVEFSKPGHGSLLQYGRLLRYTPHKHFSGKDSFLYTISDVNRNLATATVNISILTAPPQFVSFPSGLQATEDLISPRFGGFSGFEIRYSDKKENISVTVKAVSGTVFLSPMLMQFWQPIWRGLSVKKGGEEAEHLILEGHVEVINFALRSIQYLGNENFSGVDAIQVSTRNTNGINKLDVPVFVEPINDPPFICAPESILLGENGDKSLIFDSEKDNFEFFVGDPDLPNFPGGESFFLVTLSVEVSDGFLQTSLPAELINSTELKVKTSYQWQPLQTYVSISRHFMIKATGIRFHATISQCNSVIQNLLYHGGEHGAVLTVKLSDMGYYGCYLDCKESTSMPLHARATINLIKRRPMSSLEAHTLGSAVVIESLVVLLLGLLLLFFTCKCAFLLVNERRRCDGKKSRLFRTQSFKKRIPSANSSDNGCFSRPFGHGSQPNFQRRAIGESSKAMFSSSGSSSSEEQSHQAPSPRLDLIPLEIEKVQTVM